MVNLFYAQKKTLKIVKKDKFFTMFDSLDSIDSFSPN